MFAEVHGADEIAFPASLEICARLPRRRRG